MRPEERSGRFLVPSIDLGGKQWLLIEEVAEKFIFLERRKGKQKRACLCLCSENR